CACRALRSCGWPAATRWICPRSWSSNRSRAWPLDQLDLAQAFLQELLRGDRNGKLGRVLRVDALRQRLGEKVRGEGRGEGEGEARFAGAFPRRIHHAVRGRAQAAVGETLQHVAHV